jgi:spore coat protein U-like protein
MNRAMRVAAAILLLAQVLTPRSAQAVGGASCMLSATPLAFGRYVPFSGVPTDFSATLTVTCTAPGAAAVPVRGTIALAGGTGGPFARRLTSGRYGLRYQLFSDPGRTVPWGDSTAGTVSVTGVVGPRTVFRQTLTVYGRILARQSGARVGLYTDQVMAQLNY